MQRERGYSESPNSSWTLEGDSPIGAHKDTQTREVQKSADLNAGRHGSAGSSNVQSIFSKKKKKRSAQYYWRLDARCLGCRVSVQLKVVNQEKRKTPCTLLLTAGCAYFGPTQAPVHTQHRHEFWRPERAGQACSSQDDRSGERHRHSRIR
jgi:hypothetical protein